MDNTLIIAKKDQNISLQLKTGQRLLDEVVFPLDIHFDTVLVSSIDKILKRNRIEKVSPLEVTLEGFGDESNMASLIARSVAEALKIK